MGGVILKTQTTVINDPVLPFYSEIPEPTSRKDLPGTTNSIVYTPDLLREYWENPDLVSHGRGSEEIWTYKSRLIWKGVIPFVIIPIPLILPVAKEKVCLTLRDGHVVSASTITSRTAGGTFGLYQSPDGNVGWGVKSWNDEPSDSQ